MIKLVLGTKNKIIKHSSNSFLSLKQSIKLNFPDAPLDFSLSYLDQDKDEICLTSDEDLSNMFKSKAKIHKVYIKQSLSQTIVIDVQRSDFLETSFDNISAIQQDKRESIGDRNLVKQFFRQSTFIKVQLNPVQKIQDQKMSLNQQLISVFDVQEFSFKQKVFSQQQKIQFLIKQEGYFKQIVEYNVTKLRPITLYISPEKLVSSRVPQLHNKQISKDQEIKKISHTINISQMIIGQKGSQKEDRHLQVHSVICSNCKDQFGIFGIRYQCILCNAFNLCSQCQTFIEHPHSLLKVKKPQQAINADILLQKYNKAFSIHQSDQNILSHQFIPSTEKQNALRLLQSAKQSYDQGLARTKNLLQQLFFKMQMSHKNPYEIMKPIKQPKIIQTPGEKAQHLSDLVRISYNQAMRFVSQYCGQTQKQRIVQDYFALKM